jgi:hypothetical protein
VFAHSAAAAETSGDPVVVVGHTGAASVLPAVAAALRGVRRMVFVDARLPPCEGTFTPGGDFLDALRALAHDGVLPVWSQWWGEGDHADAGGRQ